MRSSTGAHYIALDHVRALACFLVFVWHFKGPVEPGPVAFPFSILNEGQTGVALFMTLSGYLFAKLLDGKSVDYAAFIWNRVLRLVPLLLLVIVYIGYTSGVDVVWYYTLVLKGLIFPTLPGGGWSITAEFHFYLILPLLLWLTRKSPWLPLSIIAAALSLRLAIFMELGTVKRAAYWTIIGRIDQFVLGVMLYQFRDLLARRHAIAMSVLMAFLIFYWWYDHAGGFDKAPYALWIVMPTIEGAVYGVLIAWYESSFSPSNKGASKFIAEIGEYSYSIYLLHFFFVFDAAVFVDHFFGMSNFYVMLPWSVLMFLVLARPIGYLSYRFIESPFLTLRRPYIKPVGEPRAALS